MYGKTTISNIFYEPVTKYLHEHTLVFPVSSMQNFTDSWSSETTEVHPFDRTSCGGWRGFFGILIKSTPNGDGTPCRKRI